tara:strand:+ start:3033 stop:3440 length:408 start_codon:yes stop_codon:yes gene_type:complete
MDHLYKFVDLSLIGLIYFFGGVCISHLVNYSTIKYGGMGNRDIKNIPTIIVFWHLCKEVIMVTMLTFLLKSIVKNLPFYIYKFFPYKGGNRIDMGGSILLSYALISYVNQDLNNKLTVFLSRLGILKNIDSPIDI